MPFPSGFVKVVLSGTVLGGKEVWSTSLSVLPPFTDGSRTDELRADLLPVVVAAASTWFRSTEARVHQTADLRLVKTNMVGTDGRYTSDEETVLQEIPAGEVRGAQTSGLLPLQNTAAVSLRTDATRGLASRGRFYPPALAAAIDANTGALVGSTPLDMATAAATMLTAINRAPGYRVIVASDIREGALRPVTRVEVGNVVDTQRRRRSALAEAYSPAPVAGG